MKLVHPLITMPLEIRDDQINVLVIEHRKTYVNVIAEFSEQIMQCTGSFILTDKESKIDISKGVDLIIDLFNLTLNQKKVITKLYAELNDVAQSAEYFMRTQELISRIKQYLDELLDESRFALAYEDKLDILGLLKYADVKLVEEKENMFEKLLDYMEMMHEYCEIKLFVFVNLKTFLSEVELVSLYKDFVYRKIPVLLLESADSKTINEYEHKLIIDEDLCII